MHEEEKLEEARFFYGEMVKSKQNREQLEFYLSAFLSATRSVLQYALKEAKTHTGGQKWHDDCLSKSKLIGFFRDKRDINIHEEPASTAAKIHLRLTDTVTIADRATIDGSSDRSPVILSVKPSLNEPPVIQYVSYKFDEWQGNEDIFKLCEMYLDELENVVRNGQKRGFLT